MSANGDFNSWAATATLGSCPNSALFHLTSAIPTYSIAIGVLLNKLNRVENCLKIWLEHVSVSRKTNRFVSHSHQDH